MSTANYQSIREKLAQLYGDRRVDSIVGELASVGLFLTDDPCIAKLHDGESYFVLRGQDDLAADLVYEWAYRLKQYHETEEHESIPESVVPKYDAAVDCADAMRRWHTHKIPD